MSTVQTPTFLSDCCLGTKKILHLWISNILMPELQQKTRQNTPA